MKSTNAASASPPRLRLRVTATAESIIRAGHPWLFADSVREQNRPGQLGELAVIFDRKDQFLAVGMFDPDSPLRVRILHAGKPQAITLEWWRARFAKTLNARGGLFDSATNGYRCINGESDGWPGLVLDRYGGTLVVKLYTAAWLPRLDDFLEPLRAESAEGSPAAVLPANPRLILRLSRNIQEIARARFNRTDGEILMGGEVKEPVVFSESGIRFGADVVRGQKTGFFLDQRENRRLVESMAGGRGVLNAFSFSGGFSLYAARGGAKSVTDLDISAHALESARRNFALNAGEPAISACRHETVQADTFEWLERSERKAFDMVILDPPSLARRESERAGAIHAYERLASLGIGVMPKGGILLAASCSAHVSAEEFFEAVRRAGAKSGRKFAEIRTTRHAPDHAATFKEAGYLKAIYLHYQ